jgi:MEMO1 family protein
MKKIIFFVLSALIFSGSSARGEKTMVTNNGSGDKSFKLDKSDRIKLLQLARKTVEEIVEKGKTYEPDGSSYSPNLKEKCGAFVTLHENGQLRGCIGQFIADGPLYLIVRDMAISSAMRDPRFMPCAPGEVQKLLIEISVLSPLKKISSIKEFKLGRDGIYIRKGMRAGTFLPQVADETGWTTEEFLGHCSQDKAGLGWEGWKDAELFTYTADVFSEKDTK